MKTGGTSLEDCTECPPEGQLPPDGNASYVEGSANPCLWECNSGFFLHPTTKKCMPCSSKEDLVCLPGTYYAACNSTSDATCQPCTNAPLAFPQNKSVAVQYVQENCGWTCMVGYFLRFSQLTQRYSCSSCLNTSCERDGYYRETCSQLNRTQNARCVQCSVHAELPLYGMLGRPSAHGKDDCAVTCQRGWWHLKQRNKCCSDNAVLVKSKGDCLCSAGFKAPSPALEGIVCDL